MEFKKLKKTVRVNGHTIDVDILIEVEEDDVQFLLDQDFESDEARIKYVNKINRGDIFAGVVLVKASALGLTGTDVLSGCELKPNNMFNSTPFDKSVEACVKDNSMVENAVNELKKILAAEHSRLLTESARLKMVAAEFKQYAK